MLPYSDETAYENSLLVQNSGELALSSMRSVFLSLTANSRGIYMIIVKHQLKNKGNPNYQGNPLFCFILLLAYLRPFHFVLLFPFRYAI